MNRKRWLISVGALTVIAGVFSYSFTPVNESKAQASVISGIVQQEEYNLSFKIGGRVESLSVREGQWVKKGDILGSLEKGEWQAKVNQAKAAIALATANVNKATTGVSVVEQTSDAKVEQAEAALKTSQDKFDALVNGTRPEQIEQLEAKLQAVQSAYDNALDMQNKTNELLQAGAVPQSKKDEADVNYEKAKAELTAAQKELQMAKVGARKEELNAAKHQVEQVKGVLNEALSGKGQVKVSAADVNVAKGQLAQAEASLEEAAAYLSYTELQAPVDGIVVHKNVKAGEMVSSGFTAITLAQPNEKWVDFYVPENKLKGLKEQQQLTLTIPSLPGTVSGTVVSINPAPQFAAQKATNYLKDTDIHSFAVKVQLKDHTDQVFAGMTAEWQGTTRP